MRAADHRPELGKSRLCLLLVVAGLGLAADQASKVWAFAPGQGPREVVPGLIAGLQARNYGAMDNLGDQSPLTGTACALLGLATIGVAGAWAGRHAASWRRLDALGGGLLGAGMLGNAADRLVLGYVRDFLYTGHTAVGIFNVADVAIVLGALLLLASWAARTGFATPGPSPHRSVVGVSWE